VVVVGRVSSSRRQSLLLVPKSTAPPWFEWTAIDLGRRSLASHFRYLICRAVGAFDGWWDFGALALWIQQSPGFH
jgi:hypothetical protein